MEQAQADTRAGVTRRTVRWASIGIAAVVCLALLGIAAGLTARKLARHRLQTMTYAPPPPGMVWVPAGDFLMGSDSPESEPDERPLRRVFVPAFYIDRYEVTNAAFKRFRPEHTFPPGEDDLPVTHVTHAEAEAYCRWIGKRLPTDAEWEKAARGTDGRRYPWGDIFDPHNANVRDGLASAVLGPLPESGVCAASGKQPGGSFPRGVSPYGCQDMAGNVWEWVSDSFSDGSRWALGPVNPRGILRGGAHAYGAFQARTSYHGFEGLTTTCNDVGFRAAMDALPAAAAP